MSVHTCRTQLDELEQLLAEVVAEPVPERPADYGQRVWRRVEGELTNSLLEDSFGTTGSRLRAPKPRWSWLDLFRPRNLVWAAAAASILVAVFLAGRFSTRLDPRARSTLERSGARKDPSRGSRTITWRARKFYSWSSSTIPPGAWPNKTSPGTIDISFERQMAENLVEPESPV